VTTPTPAEKDRHDRIMIRRNQANAQDKVLRALVDAFDREELGQMFDAMAGEPWERQPHATLTYMVGEAWGSYEEIRAGELL